MHITKLKLTPFNMELLGKICNSAEKNLDFQNSKSVIQEMGSFFVLMQAWSWEMTPIEDE